MRHGTWLLEEWQSQTAKNKARDKPGLYRVGLPRMGCRFTRDRRTIGTRSTETQCIASRRMKTQGVVQLKPLGKGFRLIFTT